MAKLIFNFGVMSCGKSLDLLRTAHEYRSSNLEVLCLKPDVDDRDGKEECKIVSRVGLSGKAFWISTPSSILKRVFENHSEDKKLDIVLVDEAQFLQREHIRVLRDIVDVLGIHVICYGLRTDFKRELFSGSSALFALADVCQEIPAICKCGKKAKFVVRADSNGEKIVNGPQVSVGYSNYYSVCSKHYNRFDEYYKEYES